MAYPGLVCCGAAFLESPSLVPGLGWRAPETASLHSHSHYRIGQGVFCARHPRLPRKQALEFAPKGLATLRNLGTPQSYGDFTQWFLQEQVARRLWRPEGLKDTQLFSLHPSDDLSIPGLPAIREMAELVPLFQICGFKGPVFVLCRPGMRP